MPDITLSRLSPSSRPNADAPAYYYGQFVGDDTDNHDMLIPASGKGKILYGAVNKTNKALTLKLYGAFVSDASIGDDGVFGIDTTGETVAAGQSVYNTENDPFPYYIVRAYFGDAPNSALVHLYVSMVAY